MVTMVVILLIMALVAFIAWNEGRVAKKVLKDSSWDCEWCGADNSKYDRNCRHCGYDRP